MKHDDKEFVSLEGDIFDSFVWWQWALLVCALPALIPIGIALKIIDWANRDAKRIMEMAKRDEE